MSWLLILTRVVLKTTVIIFLLNSMLIIRHCHISRDPRNPWDTKLQGKISDILATVSLALPTLLAVIVVLFVL